MPEYFSGAWKETFYSKFTKPEKSSGPWRYCTMYIALYQKIVAPEARLGLSPGTRLFRHEECKQVWLQGLEHFSGMGE